VSAEAANQAKSHFLATMSHELRTPLNAIAGYADLLALGIHGPVTPEQQGALQRIQRSQKHLLALINEVLNYARLEAGALQYDLQPIRVRAALAGVESFVMPQVLAKGLRLTVEDCDPELVVLADVEKLNQVLLNLLSNAVKFTETGGEVYIRCGACGGRSPGAGLAAAVTADPLAAGDRQVQIVVADTGIGIAPDQLERVFEPFVQVGRTLSSGGEGTGLGLAISRDLARGMGGDLQARSRPGLGSTFTLLLPQASPDSPAVPASPHASPDSGAATAAGGR
jgi:signal transduction histidine kinase